MLALHQSVQVHRSVPQGREVANGLVGSRELQIATVMVVVEQQLALTLHVVPHELNLGQARGPDHPDGARPATQNVGQISYIVPDMAALREFNKRFKAEGTEILRTVTHGISVSIYFHDPEDNVGEVYFKTGYIVKQGFGRPIDLDTQTDEEILAYSKSFEKTEGPFQGAKLPVG